MPFVTRKSLFGLLLLAVVAALLLGGFIGSGMYNVGADDPHTRPVSAMIETMRERSIEARAGQLKTPDLKDPARIIQGAGNYDAMCKGCHLAPGMQETELSKGLYPAPPVLAKATVEAAKAFWVIKHGIKASGMPAWGKSMNDEYLWNMAAFLQELPKLDAERYRAMVAGSGGHSHGGGETGERHHEDGAADDHGDMPMDEPKPQAHPSGASAATEHRHADGTVESHPAPQPVDTDDGHDHEQ